MLRKTIMGVVFMVVMLIGSTALAFFNGETDFNGIPWGSDLRNSPDLQYMGADMDETFFNPVNTVTLVKLKDAFNIEVQGIQYACYQGQFYKASLYAIPPSFFLKYSLFFLNKDFLNILAA